MCFPLSFFSSLSFFFNVSDDVVPYFKTEPGLPQIHLEGNRLVLTCLAEGSWPLEFKWTHNDSELTTYTSEYKYVIPSLQRLDAGFYRCVVRNRMGALLQRRSEVQVAYMGDFTDADERRVVSEGRAAVLSLPPISSCPRPQVTWFRDGHKIIPSSRIAITLENQLVILAAAASDAGAYYVQAVNERNGENKTSPPVHLSIASECPAPVAPVIVVPPSNRSVVAGSSETTLECIANARPAEELSVTWKRNGVRVTTGLHGFGRRLTISNPTSSDTGVYICEAALPGRSSEIHLFGLGAVSVFFLFKEPPYFIAEPKSRILAEVEENVDIVCEAMGVPPPALQWFKDAISINKLQNPRYQVLAGGGLRVRQLRPEDSGIFQCLASNAGGEVQTHTYLDVTNVAPAFTQLPVDTTVTDGTTAVLRCEVSGAPRPAIVWSRGSHILASGSVRIPRFMLLESGGLQIAPVSIQDAGSYTCHAANSEGSLDASATLTVWSEDRGPRGPIYKSAICHVRTTFWFHLNCHVQAEQNYPFTCRQQLGAGGRHPRTWDGANPSICLGERGRRFMRMHFAFPCYHSDGRLQRFELVLLLLSDSPWKVHLSDVGPEMTGVTVRGLTPARTYQFRVCAVNQVARASTALMLPEEPPSAPPKNIVASGRTNQSIMVQWQPPPEPEHNGVLRGYILRYRLAGLPGEYQQRNISSPEVSYCLVTELIIWTQYEIQVAAYNGAGLGVFSRAVTEYTLQGVPTAPPQNVQVEAVNSTTIQFLWNPPPQQFINGINQGYKLLAWPDDVPEAVTVVTIAPDFHGVHHGYITNLKKFTAYFTSVLCFTTPGDGPPSTPQLIRTHEDKPGAVGHLSFTEILDTSLKVSWQEPLEKNGIITGYQVSWEVYGQSTSRLTLTLNSSTHEYKIQGLSSLTTYTIDVAAVTAAGAGVPTSSTISSGVPPELPGAPSNLVISNISPRSATLQFRPGYDGKTAISRWIVQGQVGAIGDEEEWVTLCEEENEPDAQMLEIPDLTPYTHYRFRMRQANVVGAGPFSQSSRVIQTLQAPPDVAPTSITVRTASETSLRLRWVPLPDSQYNGNPESVGYRIKYWCPDLPSAVLTQVISDRLEREFTVEGLEEWTEYELQMQAFNAIGAGPWSAAVRGRTRESVPSAAPENVSAEAVSSTQILLTWASVPEPDQNGLILGYKVRILFRAKDLDPEPRSHVVRGNHTQSALLAGLGKFVLYELQVLAFTRIGNGVPSVPPILERTKDDAPGPPVRLVFPEVRLTSVRIVWQPPEEPNGIILGYQIAYRLASSSPNTFTTVEVGATVRQFTATELAPESAYVFRLSAKTRQGWGEPLEATVITTEKRERPAPPRELQVPQADVTARSLCLRWVPGSDGASPIRYFTLQLRELPRGQWQTYSSSISHEATACVVERLRPFTSYKLRLKATNDIGDSDFSAETEAVTTLQDGEQRAHFPLLPVPLTVLSLQPPRDESLNGLLQGYRIYYRELDLGLGSMEGAPGPHAGVHSGASLWIPGNHTRPQVEMKPSDLKKYRRYEVVLTAYNVIGEGPASAPVEVFVGEAAPAQAPQRVHVNPLTASQLEVAWEPPPPESQNGIIQGYKIYYWEADSQNDTEKMRVLFLPETTAKLKNLTSHTKYLVSISAFNAAGDGPRSEPQPGCTHQAAPGTPSFLAFSEITSTTLNVSWGEPVAANGVLQGYRVVYEPLAPVQGVSKVVTVDVKGNWPRWLKVRDLTKGVTYFFRVQARTIAYGPELQANVTAGPAEGEYQPHVSVTKSTSELTLHWTEGRAGRTPTTGYVIEARPSDEGLWDMFAKDIPRGATAYTVSLDQLRQGVTYEFRVVAVNQAGYGEPSSPSAAVSAQVETPFYEQWWFLLVMALSSLLVILLVVFSLLLHGQSKKYRNCGTGPPLQDHPHTLPRQPPSTRSLSPGPPLSLAAWLSLFRPSVHPQVTDSESEDAPPQHSFVNHYLSDPTYYNSWKRRAGAAPHRYEAVAGAEAGPAPRAVVTTQSAVFAPAARGARTPLTGFSSFV
uniref:Uncharacterized protein n=1 Tax=Bos indicus x Bos taurus TaxID=30522 RepID=A0A4W2C8V6_BOBOX